jgi:spore maturation protein CgeB
LKIVIIGLSITSSWGNGHAVTYRSLVAELTRRGHRVLFLERDVPWYAQHRDLTGEASASIALYSDLEELQQSYAAEVRDAACVIVGSYVPEGIAVGEWVRNIAEGVTAFYDIDTPVTISHVELDNCDYLDRTSIPSYDLYLSFTGGPLLSRIESEFGSPMTRPLYCSVEPEAYFPEDKQTRWDLGYLGTYSEDRQPALNSMLLEAARRWPAGRFVVAGSQYPQSVGWPVNVGQILHLPPPAHVRFYNAQRFTLNITRADMVRAGYSPSIRLFEAAACATPVITDYWQGLESFFKIGEEILTASGTEDILRTLWNVPESRRLEIGQNARRRVLSEHTPAHRVDALEEYIAEAATKRRLSRRRTA